MDGRTLIWIERFPKTQMNMLSLSMPFTPPLPLEGSLSQTIQHPSLYHTTIDNDSAVALSFDESPKEGPITLVGDVYVFGGKQYIYRITTRTALSHGNFENEINTAKIIAHTFHEL